MEDYMNKLLIGVIVFALVFSCGEQISLSDPNLEKEWRSIMRDADFHTGALRRMKKTIEESNQNQDALMYIAGLISKVGFHTTVLEKVAEDTANAKLEQPGFFRDLGELAVIRLSNSVAVMELSQALAEAESEAEISLLREKYDELYSTAEARSVADAIKQVDEMFKKVQNAAGDL
jgi:uncharacterized protein HemY